MKIVDVRVYVLDTALAEPFAYSQAWYERRGACLVEIIGEDGNSGWGEAFGPARLTAPIIDFYKSLLIGEDALATEAIWQSLYNRLRDHGQKGLAIEALSAVDIALWDLKGRHLGLPVHRLIDAVDRLLALYRDHHEGEEELGAFFRRVPPSMATDALKDLAQLLPNEIGEQDLIDLGENQAFNPEVMDGECSA